MCFEYDDSASIFEQSVVKCRKPHRCEGCRRVILKGEPAACCSGLFDHIWFRYYVCYRCQRLICAIAAKELNEGCPWHTAWIAPQDLSEYVGEIDRYSDEEEYGEFAEKRIEPMGMPTIKDCHRVVDDIHLRITGYARPDETERCFAMKGG